MRTCKKDLFLVAGVLFVAAIMGLYFWISDRNKGKVESGILEITIDGELYGDFPLDKDTEMTVKSSYGSNTVVIEQGIAYVKEADCPDKVCAGMPEISHDGEVICCLPHRLFLTVRGGEDAAYDAIAY